MKIKFSKFLTIFLLFIQTCVFFNADIVKGYAIKTINGKYSAPSELYNEVKKINLGSNLECVLKFKYFPEFIKSYGKQSDTTYGRNVIVHVAFYHNKKGFPGEKILEYKLKVTFTYNKNSLVYIDIRDDDINSSICKSDADSKKWKIADSREIIYGKKSCIISSMLTIFKTQNLTNKIKYIENSHIDIICTSDGNIAINSKSL